MLKLMSTALVALSLAAANPCLADTDVFSFARGDVWSRSDIWQLTQFNSRTFAKGFGFTTPGGTSRVRGDCVYGNDGITRCEDCEVDWDGPVPEMICIANMICYDNYGKPTEC